LSLDYEMERVDRYVRARSENGARSWCSKKTSVRRDELDWYGVSKYPLLRLSGHQTATSNVSKRADSERVFVFPESGWHRAGHERPESATRHRAGIQSLVTCRPDGNFYNSEDWGKNRVRLNALSQEPKPHRGGFYLHDSHKATRTVRRGGCSFFTRLRAYAKEQGARRRPEMARRQVKYPTSRPALPAARRRDGTR